MYCYFLPSTPISGLVHLSRICDPSEDDANVATSTDDTATYSPLEATPPSLPHPVEGPWKGGQRLSADSVAVVAVRIRQSKFSVTNAAAKAAPWEE